jgi:hypothetical protein
MRVPTVNSKINLLLINWEAIYFYGYIDRRWLLTEQLVNINGLLYVSLGDWKGRQV